MLSIDDNDELQNRDISGTFIKGMSVLKSFDDSQATLTLARIAGITGLDRAVVRRLVLTLVHLGYVKKSGRNFSLTHRVLVLAGGFLRGNQFGIHIQPILNKYAAHLGSAISLAMLDGDIAVYVAQSTLTNSPISFGFTIGSRLPLLHTAIGRMLLAFADPDLASSLVETSDFDARTTLAIIDRNVIREKIIEVRQQEYAIVDGEFEEGVMAFAVPIGTAGDLKAVLGVSEPQSAVKSRREQTRYINVLQDCARELSSAGVLG